MKPFFPFRHWEKILLPVITGLVLIKCLLMPNALDVLILAGLLVLMVITVNGKKL